jgi:alkylation response protein AidB-like acyl-CoA dehydrogenase
MPDTILYDSAMRLFGDHATPQVLAAAETGAWPAELWDAVTTAGYLDVLTDGPEAMVEAVTILRAAGHHAAPIPLAETMLARWLCTAARHDAPDGPLTVAFGEGDPAPWGRNAAALAIVGESDASLLPLDRVFWRNGANLAGEPRDRLTGFDPRAPVPLAGAPEADTVFGIAAVMRAAQMAGAMEAALDLSVRYANDRVQFGRPIGKFQAIQQQLALLAEETAASLVVVESAARSISEGRPSAGIAIAAAKIRTGEAAGKVAEIAHQVHGAIGFTEEHSLHYLTRRLWSWRDEFGDEAHWAGILGEHVAAAGRDGLWPLITEP